MKIVFLDTSALVKRYYKESGTEEVDDIIESYENVVVSSLSVIEAISAFRRKYNRQELDEEDLNMSTSNFFQEALNKFTILPIEESTQDFSFELILENDLRTLDSIQLSTALSLQNQEDKVVFVSADKELVSTARNKNLKAINPD